MFLERITTFVDELILAGAFLVESGYFIHSFELYRVSKLYPFANSSL